MSILIEFAVLVEISDHIFRPYPVIRRLGRFLALAVCAVFFAFYVLPAFLESQRASLVLLDFVKRTSLVPSTLTKKKLYPPFSAPGSSRRSKTILFPSGLSLGS